jgi:crotonobetainyl-CoA:carnitine CoA-transferase CaiB-like acyl-CoA transferase
MESDGLLAGVRVVDLTIWRPGPYATQLLGELGADVCKIEPPGGDPMRAYPELFRRLNVNKRSVVLDLKRPGGRAQALALAAGADVVVESFRPGVAARLGVDYGAVRGVNPAVVYCSLSGMGQTGPLASAPGHDLNFQAWGGALAPVGGEPVVAAVPIADLAGGLAAAFAICAALVRRRERGEGERIDCAIADVMATWTGAERPVADGAGAGARGVPGYGVFASSDGHVALGVLTEDHFWTALCDALGLVDCRDLPFPERTARLPELQARIGAAIALHRRDDVCAMLLAAGVPAAPVLDREEVVRHEHFVARAVMSADARATGALVRFEDHPARVRTAAPRLGEHQAAPFRAPRE